MLGERKIYDFFRKINILYRTTYKSAYEIKVAKNSKSDLKRVKEEYLNIIQVLKDKIAETEELIRVKKLVKSEFAYKLSKNMLKTISNLSMEVMNLNQVSLKGISKNNIYEIKILLYFF